jgi:hypothetical protein
LVFRPVTVHERNWQKHPAMGAVQINYHFTNEISDLTIDRSCNGSERSVLWGRLFKKQVLYWPHLSN